MFKKVADTNMWASYRLGRIFLFGKDDIASDREKALQWITKSVADGNEYAEKLLNYGGGHSYMISNTIVSLLADIGRLIEEDHARSQRKTSMKIDKKLQRMIQKKKRELGIKSDITQLVNSNTDQPRRLQYPPFFVTSVTKIMTLYIFRVVRARAII